MSQSASELTDRDLAGAGQSRHYGLHGIKALFFDLDNTLIDTVSASRAAIAEVLAIRTSSFLT